ncbi:MAG: FtsW/RodA/SpoVE family cell cycle protein, partial [Patescibacteria group bacterium]
SIAEHWGFLGASLVVSAFMFVFWRILKIGIEAENNFAKLFVFGYGALIFTQFAVNIGMNLSLLPITGLSLPFVSYGGSGLAALFLGLGILQSFRVNK